MAYKRKIAVRFKVPKSKILKVALHLFSSKGYSETKMSEIARRAGLSVGALYLRFKSKEGLCLELIQDQTKDFDEITRNLTSHNSEPQEALKAYIAFNLRYAFKRKQLLSMFIREYKLPFIRPLKRNFFNTQRKIIKDILAAGVKRKIFKPMNYEETASLIFASIRGTIMLKLVFGASTPRELNNSLFELITHGIKEDV